jgi:hypothetical protein
MLHKAQSLYLRRLRWSEPGNYLFARPDVIVIVSPSCTRFNIFEKWFLASKIVAVPITHLMLLS